MTLNTQVELIEKKLDLLYVDHPVLNKEATELPSFLNNDGLNFIIKGQNFSEAWNTYTMRVNATVIESPDAPPETSYFLVVRTIVDCLTGLSFARPNLF